MSISKFKNAVVIITGAASGMGRNMAIQAAQKGSSVIATDVNETGLAETKEMAKKAGFPIETQRLDVGQKSEIDNFAQQILPTLNNRRLILINNAGIALMTGNFDETSSDDFERLININLWGGIRLTKAFYPYFLAQNDGHIVNISSVFGLGGVTLNSAYCTAKFGLRGFTESLRMELLGTNVRTTSVHPGGIKTNIVQNSTPNSQYITPQMQTEFVKEFDSKARTTAEKAASLILDAAERNKNRLVIGSDAKFFDIIVRLFPTRFTQILKKEFEYYEKLNAQKKTSQAKNEKI